MERDGVGRHEQGQSSSSPTQGGDKDDWLFSLSPPTSPRGHAPPQRSLEPPQAKEQRPSVATVDRSLYDDFTPGSTDRNGAVGGGGRASVGAGQLDLGELDQLLLDMEGESLYGITDTQAKSKPQAKTLRANKPKKQGGDDASLDGTVMTSASQNDNDSVVSRGPLPELVISDRIRSRIMSMANQAKSAVSEVEGLAPLPEPARTARSLSPRAPVSPAVQLLMSPRGASLSSTSRSPKPPPSVNKLSLTTSISDRVRQRVLGLAARAKGLDRGQGAYSPEMTWPKPPIAHTPLTVTRPASVILGDRQSPSLMSATLRPPSVRNLRFVEPPPLLSRSLVLGHDANGWPIYAPAASARANSPKASTAPRPLSTCIERPISQRSQASSNPSSVRDSIRTVDLSRAPPQEYSPRPFHHTPSSARSPSPQPPSPRPASSRPSTCGSSPSASSSIGSLAFSMPPMPPAAAPSTHDNDNDNEEDQEEAELQAALQALDMDTEDEPPHEPMQGRASSMSDLGASYGNKPSSEPHTPTRPQSAGPTMTSALDQHCPPPPLLAPSMVQHWWGPTDDHFPPQDWVWRRNSYYYNGGLPVHERLYRSKRWVLPDTLGPHCTFQPSLHKARLHRPELDVLGEEGGVVSRLYDLDQLYDKMHMLEIRKWEYDMEGATFHPQVLDRPTGGKARGVVWRRLTSEYRLARQARQREIARKQRALFREVHPFRPTIGRRPKDEAAGDAKEAAASVMSPSGRSKGPATIWDRLYDDWSKLVKKKDSAAAATPPDCTFTPTLTHRVRVLEKGGQEHRGSGRAHGVARLWQLHALGKQRLAKLRLQEEAKKPPKPLSREEEEKRECTFQPKTNWSSGPHCWADRRLSILHGPVTHWPPTAASPPPPAATQYHHYHNYHRPYDEAYVQN